jgi:hypothetical protein
MDLLPLVTLVENNAPLTGVLFFSIYFSGCKSLLHVRQPQPSISKIVLKLSSHLDHLKNASYLIYSFMRQHRYSRSELLSQQLNALFRRPFGLIASPLCMFPNAEVPVVLRHWLLSSAISSWDEWRSAEV